MTTSYQTVLLGPSNAEQAVGLPWRRVREIALRLGVQTVACGRTRLVPLADLLAALEGAGTKRGIEA